MNLWLCFPSKTVAKLYLVLNPSSFPIHSVSLTCPVSLSYWFYTEDCIMGVAFSLSLPHPHTHAVICYPKVTLSWVCRCVTTGGWYWVLSYKSQCPTLTCQWGSHMFVCAYVSAWIRCLTNRCCLALVSLHASVSSDGTAHLEIFLDQLYRAIKFATR